MSAYSFTDNFIDRHIGPDKKQIEMMLAAIGIDSIDLLVDETIPKEIRLKNKMEMGEPFTEYQFLNYVRELAKKNIIAKSYIGMGYYPTVTPPPIQRNILENPGWYTQYTPYQAEISQGRLEALLNFQTMIIDLTGLPIANASLLDEATAAAEAMIMAYNQNTVKNKNKIFVAADIFPHTIDVLKTRANPLNIELVIDSPENFVSSKDFFALVLQYPNNDGEIKDYRKIINAAKENNVQVIVASDLLSLTKITPPGEFGADVVVGSTQRFGVPMGYGGPHAAFFSCKDDYKRIIPGRIIGASIDMNGNLAYRMALQTREQHIRREKATSNICTSQVLLAIIAGMYGVYHGPNGLIKIADRVHSFATLTESLLVSLGFEQTNNFYFDTLKIKVDKKTFDAIRNKAEKQYINFRYFDDNAIGISFSEANQLSDVIEIVKLFAESINKNFNENESQIAHQKNVDRLHPDLIRQSNFLSHPIFNSYHSETELLRYSKKLENKDLSLTASMIPLGSCTMKLNSTASMLPITIPEFALIHPFAPEDQVLGYKKIIEELENYLTLVTGFSGVSLQPNSGAQGEYAGLMVIRAYHISRGEHNRNVVLIPCSAHGTNPASAVMAGMKVVVVNCDENGNVDFIDLKKKAELYKDDLSSLMVTYPSTHGVFEDNIMEICEIVHSFGGQVYMDGANMNAQVGLTSPKIIGADVCHLNLHKTFAIPHGGGGPGMGPICCAEHLRPFLPGHSVVKVGGEKAINAISAAPYGSSNILLISLAYIKMLAGEGLTEVTRVAILNANYLKARLEKHFKVLYTGVNGRVAHELIFDMREFKKSANIEVEDIAKRLMDYGFHAPTVSFPVVGTLMVEPTESESKIELDRFCDSMISIKNEILEIESGVYDTTDNVLKNAPHTAQMVISDNWQHKYSREKAAFPTETVRGNKFWPSVARVNSAYGDRNLVCSCVPISAYSDSEVQLTSETK
ncbi:MAG: glycine dehydrogenase (aminomethyl-transferring) [Chlorobiaceae bacterium]|nr:glycine dehydrogenase (aminomethyl-transferring) [Chlorobiaceae bacterium]MBA4309740.1 glycine dehydrogenase (aminomethyl-transferring) [Chlorobiaceae bacterium]